MKNKLVTAAIVIVVIVVVGYGGYRLYNHYKRINAVPVAQAPSAKPTQTPTPTQPTNAVYQTTQNSKLGTFLTDLKGMTLYTFAKDKPGVSNCTGACLKLWPAYVATVAATTSLPANVSVITRTDGIKQYAYKGMPLYYYHLDKKPGDTFGQGVLGIWFVAKP